MRIRSFPIFLAFLVMGVAGVIPVEEEPERTSELSELRRMAILGGAIVLLVVVTFIGNGQKASSFAVPVVCFVYLFLISLKRQESVGIDALQT